MAATARYIRSKRYADDRRAEMLLTLAFRDMMGRRERTRRTLAACIRFHSRYHLSRCHLISLVKL